VVLSIDLFHLSQLSSLIFDMFSPRAITFLELSCQQMFILETNIEIFCFKKLIWLSHREWIKCWWKQKLHIIRRTMQYIC